MDNLHRRVREILEQKIAMGAGCDMCEGSGYDGGVLSGGARKKKAPKKRAGSKTSRAAALSRCGISLSKSKAGIKHGPYTSRMIAQHYCTPTKKCYVSTKLKKARCGSKSMKVDGKKKLTDYQKFVKRMSKANPDLHGPDLMAFVGPAWKVDKASRGK